MPPALARGPGRAPPVQATSPRPLPHADVSTASCPAQAAGLSAPQPRLPWRGALRQPDSVGTAAASVTVTWHVGGCTPTPRRHPTGEAVCQDSTVTPKGCNLKSMIKTIRSIFPPCQNRTLRNREKQDQHPRTRHMVDPASTVLRPSPKLFRIHASCASLANASALLTDSTATETASCHCPAQLEELGSSTSSGSRTRPDVHGHHRPGPRGSQTELPQLPGSRVCNRGSCRRSPPDLPTHATEKLAAALPTGPAGLAGCTSTASFPRLSASRVLSRLAARLKVLMWFR